MAVNASSHNAPGIATAPTSEAPPPMLADTKIAVLKAAASDTTGQSLPGKDATGTAPSEKAVDDSGKTADGEVHVRFKGGGVCGILKHLEATKKTES